MKVLCVYGQDGQELTYAATVSYEAEGKQEGIRIEILYSRILRKVAIEIEQEPCLKKKEEVVEQMGEGVSMVQAVLSSKHGRGLTWSPLKEQRCYIYVWTYTEGFSGRLNSLSKILGSMLRLVGPSTREWK